MAIISNHISDVDKMVKRLQKAEAQQQTPQSYLDVSESIEDMVSGNTKTTDVSDILGGDDLWT